MSASHQNHIQVQKLQFKMGMIFFILLVCMLVSSESVWAQKADDQTVLPGDRMAIVNPIPAARDFVANNKQHQILMAVIDTGVDYNQPQLLQNIHFKLDSKGKPVGFGWDFVGKDAWPAPMVAFSADLSPNAPVEEINNEKRIASVLTDFITANPSMKKYFDVHRNLSDELGEGLFHGTHVAGLMVYDEPRLGLLAYRALPARVTYMQTTGQMRVQDPKGDLIKAVQQAVADGARVVNMSLALSIPKDLEQQNPVEYQNTLILMQQIKAFAIANPQVAFVAASGNEGAWIDDRARQSIPCGVDAKNILCVGALSQDGYIASFSNIVLPDFPFLLAPGDEILSTFPSQFCNLDYELLGMMLSPQMSFLMQNADQKNYFYSQIVQTCQSQTGFIASSGTSMATPIAARMIGKILLDNPKLSGVEAVQKLLDSTVELKVGKMSMRKLLIEKPSWYPNKNVSPKFLDIKTKQTQGAQNSKYFEFYTK